jgi:hypothetical protein
MERAKLNSKYPEEKCLGNVYAELAGDVVLLSVLPP